MKKAFNNILITMTLAVVLTTVSSCKKYLDIPYPNNSINTKSAFTNMATIDGMMNNLYYSFFNTAAVSGGLYYVLPCTADEGYNPTSVSLSLDPQTSNITANLYLISWDNVYNNIYQANVMLESIPGATAPGFTDDKKKAYTAAAKTIRAYDYFLLVRIFGDVPLITNTDVPVNSLKPRDPAATVYAAIEKDLQDAIAALPATLGIKYFINNKYIPEAILAEVYLTEGKWAQAEAAATDIIGSNQYQLAALTDIFLQSSKEGIFESAPAYALFNSAISYKVGRINRFTWFPEGSFRSYLEGDAPALSPDLLNSFEAGDQRLVNWVTLRNANNYSNPNNRMFPYKYKYSYVYYTGTIPAGREENDKVIRLAEIYLLRAEVRARQNNITGAAADLNIIRTRAGLANTTASSQSDMIDAVLNERRHELFFEGGWRWFDLVRTGKANSVLSAISYKSANWKPYMVLFPLSPANLASNPNLTQTPGY